MKDIKNLVIYGGLSVVVILLLANLGTGDLTSDSIVAYLAIFFVIVLPIALAVFIAKKEKQKREAGN